MRANCARRAWKPTTTRLACCRSTVLRNLTSSAQKQPSQWSEASFRGDSLLWLSSYESLSRDAPALQRCVDALRARVVDVLERRFAFGVQRTTVQLARYPAGARYVRHLDATPSLANGRRLTVLLYLNPRWSANDAGQLRLYDLDDASVDVEPIGARVLMMFFRWVRLTAFLSHSC